MPRQVGIILAVAFTLGFISCSHTTPSNNTVAEAEVTGGSSDDTTSTNTDKTPTIYDEFASHDADTWEVEKDSPGDVVFNNPDPEAVDGATVKIYLKGDPSLGVDDFPGPGDASNKIATQKLLSFGEYRSRIKFASCANAAEEVVSAMFTYWDEGKTDKNGNGKRDYSEIDIEIACSDPEIIEFSIYTQYLPVMRKVSRIVNLATGDVRQTKYGEEDHYGCGDKLGKPIAALPIADFNSTAKFYEMGFDWKKDSVRFFIVSDGKEITLWNFKDSEWKKSADEASYVPQFPAEFMFNIWHSNEIWFGANAGDPGDYPSKDAVLEVDWTKYWME